MNRRSTGAWLSWLPSELRETVYGVILPKLTESAQEALRRSGPTWWPELDVCVRLEQSEQAISLRHFGFKRILVGIDALQLLKGCQAAGKARSLSDLLEASTHAVYSMVRLWAGHYDHCPYDAWRHHRLCEEAALGGYGRIDVGEQQWDIAVAVASLFEMSLVTYWIAHAEGEPFVRGLCQQRTINRVQHGLLGELYVRTQALLAPGAWAPCWPMPPLSPRSLVDVLAPAVISRAFGVRVRPHHGRLRITALYDVPRSYLQWGPRVRALARLLVPYLSAHNATGGMVPGPGEPDGNEDGGTPGFMQSPFGARRRASQSPGGAGPTPGGGEQPGTDPGSLPDERYDSLDRYYRRHAASLSVRTEAAEDAPPVRPDNLTVGYLDSEPAPLTAMVSSQIDWFRLRVHTHDGEPRLQLARRVEPLTIPLAGEKRSGEGPLNLLLLVDSSGSMHFRTDEPDPGARGEYDIVLRACYGIFQHIESLPTADAIRVACLNFSARTFESGWHPLSRLRAVKRTLLSYQGGGTVLDPRCLRRTFESRPGEFLAIAITDGSLGNTEEATVEIGNIVRAGCDFTLVHVGDANAFTRAIEQLGCPVHLATRAEDLIGTTLGIARQRYASVEGRRGA